MSADKHFLLSYRCGDRDKGVRLNPQSPSLSESVFFVVLILKAYVTFAFF